MALRTIREYGDEVLAKKCKEIKLMTPGLSLLIKDMFETMYDAGGVGLAAPQVGVLKRVCVIDTAGSEEDPEPYVLINPEIILAEGEQEGYEGCLSLPGKSGIVKRPDHVIVRALNEKMQPYELEAEGLLARAICHETDHLDGKMYVELVEGELVNNEDLVAAQEDGEEDPE
ncbi:MAG: peptide deformylase [Lachnospiraceae bacterium]|nr:peptide deformylase [Lachnospiraceae bacterium]